MLDELKKILYSKFVEVDGSLDTPCWIYTGCHGSHGYGQLTYRSMGMLAHRASYEVHFGCIPEGEFVCHRCDTRKCINPNHFFLGDAKDNTDDMVVKGRDRFEINRKLTDDQARLVRKAYFDNISQSQIARQFGISQATVSRIGTGVSYWWI